MSSNIRFSILLASLDERTRCSDILVWRIQYSIKSNVNGRSIFEKAFFQMSIIFKQSSFDRDGWLTNNNLLCFIVLWSLSHSPNFV